MTNVAPNVQGDFVWYELLTSDADAAGEFYGKVVGWTSTPSHQSGMDYRFFFAGDGSDDKDGVGGYTALTDEMCEDGAQPGWVTYIAVNDVDASADSIKAAGGAVHMPPWDPEGVGRMAMVADPQGAVFYIMRGPSDETSHSFAKYGPKLGHAAWNELASSDPSGAWTFYGSQFGWTKDGEMDMGPMGKYEFIKSDVGIGAIMPLMPEMPVSMWGFYFRVADIDAAAELIKANGGTVFADPMEIPGGEFSLNASDPQGAMFGLVGPRKGT